MTKLNRRNFLGKSTRLAVSAVAMSAMSYRNVPGANERLRVALIGCGGRGSYVMRGLIEAGAELTHLCDLQPERLDSVAKFLSEVQEQKPILTKEMRQVLDSPDVDAVVVATPDHWHTPAAILAMEAGKDVYVEKPHAHNIWESRKMIETARKHDRILQVGTQNRSAAYTQAAVKYIQSGKLGEIHLVKVFNMKPGGPFHLGKTENIPNGFDWNTWLGAAPRRPWHQSIFHGGWHQFWDFSGGDVADDGIHQIDLALMLMGDPGLPKGVSAMGGRLAHKGDDSEVPDVLEVSYEFNDFVMTFEQTNYPAYMRKTTATIRRNDEFPYWTQNATRIELYGANQMMTIGRHGGGWQVTGVGGKVIEQMYGRFPDAEHQQNFLECVKAHKRPNADIAIAHPACVMVHLPNIAHRVGNKGLKFDPTTEKFINAPEANALLKRTYREGFEPV